MAAYYRLNSILHTGFKLMGLGGLTSQFRCSFHCDPPTCVADPPSSFFTIRTSTTYVYSVDNISGWSHHSIAKAAYEQWRNQSKRATWATRATDQQHQCHKNVLSI